MDPSQLENAHNDSDLRSRVLKTVRNASSAIRLIQLDEIKTALSDEGIEFGELLNADVLITRLLESENDVDFLSSSEGKLYYFMPHLISRSYAKLLMGKVEDPVSVAAEFIRENSRIYPRPVAANVFTEAPFCFPYDQIEDLVAIFETDVRFSDIVKAVTSTGNVYFFSNDFLENDHGAMLSEWLDVGQFLNP